MHFKTKVVTTMNLVSFKSHRAGISLYSPCHVHDIDQSLARGSIIYHKGAKGFHYAFKFSHVLQYYIIYLLFQKGSLTENTKHVYM